MNKEMIVGGITFLFLLLVGGLFLFKVGSFVYGLVSSEESITVPQTEQTQSVDQNQTAQQQPTTNSDYNLDYWKVRIQERKANA